MTNKRMVRDPPDFNHDERLWRRGRRVSMKELLAWFAVISVALAVPIALDLPLLPVIFYGPLGALTWRLSKAMPFSRAVLVAVTVAFILTCLFVPILR